MTHEELIDLVSKGTMGQDNRDFSMKVAVDSAKALLAVLEMHTPALDSEIDEFSDNETLGCAGCGFDFNYGTWEANYPCRTIQVIEKELK